MTAEQLPTFPEWLRKHTDNIATVIEVEGAETVFTWFQRVQRNMITDEPMFNAHVKTMKEEATSRARIQGVNVKDWHVVVLKPEDLQVGDREEMFPQHAKYTNVIYLFGYTAPEQDWEPLGEDVSTHTMRPVKAHDDGRQCSHHQRLNAFTFDGTKKCLRPHEAI